MRFAIILLSVLGLSAATGCARQATHVAAPDSSDPMWTPPGEATLMVHGPASSNVSNTTALAAPQPNKTQIHTRQLRAANY